MGEPLHVLIVEDRPADADLMVRELRKAGYDPVWRRVDHETALRANLSSTLDVILTDFSLPQVGSDQALDALRVLEIARESKLRVPVLVVSGSLRDEDAATCLELGAVDYVLKDRMARLGPAVRKAIDARLAAAGQREAEAATARSEARLHQILATIPDVVWSVSMPDARLRYMSPAGAELFGRPVEEFYDDPRAWLETAHADDREKVKALVQQTVQTGRGEVEFRVLQPGGGVRHAVARAWCAYSNGKPDRVEGITTDVTERRAAEDQRRHAAHLERLNEFKSQFLAMVAHDLNNALSPMSVNIKLVRDELARLGQDRSKPVDSLKASIGRLSGFLADLLDASRLQSGQLVVSPQRFDLALVLREQIEALRPQADAAGVTVSADLPPALELKADPRRADQVIGNLLSNALKFTPAGGSIAVRLATEDGSARLDIRDSGRGLAPGDRERLFQPFTRIGDQPQGQHTGTGLGLFICRGLVAAHDGRITVESPGLGQGATFTVWLPIGHPKEP